MTTLEGPEVRVFATEEARQKSRHSYILMLKLTLLPFLTIVGFMSGAILIGAGVPRGLGLLCSLVLGPGLPWLALRALNRRLRFWFALRPDGLEVGPEKFGWRVPYEQVALVRESYLDEPGDRYLEVVADSRSAKVLLNTDDVKRGALALVERCPCAVRVDERGDEHLPVALEGDLTTESARRAVSNLAVLRRRYAQATRRMGVLLLVCMIGLAIVAASYLGVLPLGAEKRMGLAIPSAFFSVVLGIAWWGQSRQLRSWDQLSERFAGPANPTEHEVEEASRSKG